MDQALKLVYRGSVGLLTRWLAAPAIQSVSDPQLTVLRPVSSLQWSRLYQTAIFLQLAVIIALFFVLAQGTLEIYRFQVRLPNVSQPPFKPS